MSLHVAQEIAQLRGMTVAQLRIKFAEVFGETTNAGNRDWLLKRVVWRLQAKAEGDITERARRRADELANDADLRLNPPRPKNVGPASGQTCTGMLATAKAERLPPPGSIVTRVYKDETLQVRVLESDFEYDGERYKSLSAVAKAITGQHCNGYAFFRLGTGVAS